VTSGLRVIVLGTRNLTSEFLEGLSLGLRNEQSGEDTAEHEEGKDLHDVVEPWGRVGRGWVTLGSERAEHALGDDGTNLAGGGRNTVRGRSVAGGETLARNDEGGRVGSEVEEKLAKDIESEEATFTEMVIVETNDDEENGKDTETHELDRLAADRVHGGDGHPVTRNGTSADDDQVSDSGVSEDFVHIVALSISDSAENDGVVETETIEGNIEEEP